MNVKHQTQPWIRDASQDRGQGDVVSKAGGHKGAADRTCVCANTLYPQRWHTQGRKSELTSCRGTVPSAWRKPPVRRKGGRTGLSARESGRHVVRERQASPILEVRPGNRQGWWKRSKFRWGGQQLTLDKTVGSQVWRHTQGSSKRPASDQGWGSSSKTAPWSLSTGSPAGRTPLHGGGSMYSQANVRAGKVLRLPLRALPSVIVVTEKVVREADGPDGRAALTAHFGWKGDRPEVRLESRSGEAVRSPKITSAARNSFDLSEGRFSKNYGADQQWLQISDPHFDKFLLPATFACWKIRFKTEVCTCSQFHTEAMLWINEVEVFESVDYFKSSRSIEELMVQTLSCSTQELLQHWTKSFRIPASRKRSVWRKWKLKKKTVSFEEDRLRTWSSNASGSQEPTILSRIMQTYLLLVFEMTIFRNYDSNWDGILLSMTQILSDDILEGLYKFRIRESEKLKDRTGSVQYGDSLEEGWTLLSQVEEKGKKEVLSRIYGRKILKPETEIMRQTSWSRIIGWKQCEQRSLGDCWQWKANGQCSKGDNCRTQPNPSPSSFIQQNERNASRTRSPRGKSPSGRMSRWPCKDYLKGTCTNSICEKWHPPECLFYKSESGCRFGEKCSYAHRHVEEQPSKRSEKNGDKSAVAMLKKHELHDRTVRPVENDSSNTRQLGCLEPPKSSSILRKSSNILKPIRCVQFTKAVLRHADIRDQNPSLGMICPGDPHQA